MKRVFLFLFLGMLFTPNLTYAQSTKGMTEAEQLGATAGLALACGAEQRLDDFELIASRILANKTKTLAEEKEQDRIYMETKLQTMRRHKRDPQMTCKEILDRFNKLRIFDSVVYSDGSVKLFDGTLLKPKHALKK